MNLALFPFTALLLLLSGVGCSPYASGLHVTTAALMQDFLGEPESPQGKATAFSAARALETKCCLGSCLFQLIAKGTLPGSTPQSWNIRRDPQLLASLASPAWDRKQYRTRFGSAGAVYQPLGPPRHRL